MCAAAWIGRTEGGTGERAVGRMRKQLHSLPLSLSGNCVRPPSAVRPVAAAVAALCKIDEDTAAASASAAAAAE